MKPGILVISHGSRDNRWVSLVDDAVQEARTALNARFTVPVEAAFLELVEGRLIQDGIDRLQHAGVTHLLVVPLFISSGSKHVDEIGWALGAYPQPRTETELSPFRINVDFIYGNPIDDDPEIAEVLLDRLSNLSADPAHESILLIGHGSDKPGFHEAWLRGLTSLAARVRSLGGYSDAAIAMLRPDLAEAAVAELRQRNPHHQILAVPVFLSEGYFSKHVIPQRLDGLDCRYDGQTLMPHAQVARWLVRQASDWVRGLTTNQ